MSKNNCLFCGKASHIRVIVPEVPESAILDQSPFACIDCAVEKGIYCQLHQRAHLSFEGSQHACLSCIEESAIDIRKRLHDFVPSFLNELPKIEADRVVAWVKTMNEVKFMDDFVGALCRAIATRSELDQKTPLEVIGDVLESSSVSRLVPSFF